MFYFDNGTFQVRTCDTLDFNVAHYKSSKTMSSIHIDNVVNATSNCTYLCFATKKLLQPSFVAKKLNGFTILPQNIPQNQPVAPKQNKYGGNCKKCGLYDDYAEQDDNGNVVCYQCI